MAYELVGTKNKEFSETNKVSGNIGDQTNYINITYTEEYDSTNNKSRITLTGIQMKTGVNIGSSSCFGKVYFNDTQVLFMNGSSYQVYLSTSYSQVSNISGNGGSIEFTHESDGKASFSISLRGGVYNSDAGGNIFGAYGGYSVSRGAVVDPVEPTYYTQYAMFGVKTTATETLECTTHASTLTINPNGGKYKNSSTNTQITRAPSITITLANPVRSGYTFTGWTKTGGGTLTNSNYTFGTSNGTVQAGWSIKKSRLYIQQAVHGDVKVGGVTYSSDSAYSIIPVGTASFNYGTTTNISAIVKTYTGYTVSFDSWIFPVSNSAGGAYVNPVRQSTTFTVGETDSVIKANFTRTQNNYTIKFNGNKGSGEMQSMTLAYTSSFTMPECEFVRNNSAFTHWNTQQNDKGTVYSAGQTCSRLADKGTITLYAQWISSGYTINLYDNTHGLAFRPIGKSPGISVVLPKPTDIYVSEPATSTYTLTANANGGIWRGTNGSAETITQYSATIQNWRDNNTSTNYPAGGYYTRDANADLYAQWAGSTAPIAHTCTLPSGTDPYMLTDYTIIIDGNGGLINGYQYTMYTARVKVPFTGWYDGNTKITSDSLITSDKTVKASYESSQSTSITFPTNCTKEGRIFLGWADSSIATIPKYTGATTTVSSGHTFYAVWGDSGEIYIGQDKYLIYIYHNGSWEHYRAYIYNNSNWEAY